MTQIVLVVLLGVFAGLLGMVPIMVLVWPRNPKRIPGIAAFGTTLGAMIGQFGSLIIR